MAGAATPATAQLARAGVPYTLHRYDVPADTADYGRAVAAALNVSAERLFKTLVVDVDGRLVVAVVPASRELDLKAVAAAAGGKRAELAERAAAERATGYVRGGISALGQRRRLPTIVDSSADGFATILVSAGRRGWQVELAPEALVRLTGATRAPIARQ
jgi:Cys-tRNA(Pro)/Cys-tRNA(Cys) deacylase